MKTFTLVWIVTLCASMALGHQLAQDSCGVAGACTLHQATVDDSVVQTAAAVVGCTCTDMLASFSPHAQSNWDDPPADCTDWGTILSSAVVESFNEPLSDPESCMDNPGCPMPNETQILSTVTGSNDELWGFGRAPAD